jgi:hypothetical protein
MKSKGAGSSIIDHLKRSFTEGDDHYEAQPKAMVSKFKLFKLAHSDFALVVVMLVLVATVAIPVVVPMAMMVPVVMLMMPTIMIPMSMPVTVTFSTFSEFLCVALPHNDVVAKFLEPTTRFKDEAFHDVMAEFLRGFDRAVEAIDTKKPESPVAVRQLLAIRIRQGWNFKRLGREKGFTSETHAGDALNAMFYQPHRFANHGRPSIRDNWNGLDATMPTLTALVTEAPSSGYLATLFLNLVESSPRAALLPFVVHATTAWCSAYAVDTNFWSEKDIGRRVCAWLDRTLTADSTSSGVLRGVAEDLMKCLDILIQSGVAQAREIEERIVGMGSHHKMA